jgi:hypothetical protein
MAWHSFVEADKEAEIGTKTKRARFPLCPLGVRNGIKPPTGKIRVGQPEVSLWRAREFENRRKTISADFDRSFRHPKGVLSPPSEVMMKMMPDSVKG